MSRDPFIDQSHDHSAPYLSSLKAGQRLFNRRYELLRMLGAGGMGVVWLARDHTEETEVALKFLPSVLLLQEGEMKRLRDEVRAGKELRHPRLVATYALEVEGGAAAIVMEHVPGASLKEKLKVQERGFFEPDEIAGWIKDVCDGLGYLHDEARRIHRDIKPANIMVDADGRARLMDFGISHSIKEGVSRHTKTSEGEAGGSTLAYASPQQLSGKPADKADDIYSLGATIYELLTGTPPFFRGGAEAVAIQIKMEPVTPAMERRAELVEAGVNQTTGTPLSDASWEALCACLDKNREKRPRTAAECVTKLIQGADAMPKGTATPPLALVVCSSEDHEADIKPVLAATLVVDDDESAPATPPQPGTSEAPVRNGQDILDLHTTIVNGRRVLGRFAQDGSVSVDPAVISSFLIPQIQSFDNALLLSSDDRVKDVGDRQRGWHNMAQSWFVFLYPGKGLLIRGTKGEQYEFTPKDVQVDTERGAVEIQITLPGRGKPRTFRDASSHFCGIALAAWASASLHEFNARRIKLPVGSGWKTVPSWAAYLLFEIEAHHRARSFLSWTPPYGTVKEGLATARQTSGLERLLARALCSWFEEPEQHLAAGGLMKDAACDAQFLHAVRSARKWKHLVTILIVGWIVALIAVFIWLKNQGM